MISVGDRRSRKTEVVEQIFRQQLTEEAIKKVERHKKRDAEKKEEEERKSFSADRPERKSLNFIRPERKSFTANRLSASSPSASGNLENPKAYEGT